MIEGGNNRLKIEAHDASRIEWSVYIPLPRGTGQSEAEVELTLEVPENIYAPHDGWDQLQLLARLSSPDEDAAASLQPLSFDDLRRATLAVARRLKLLRETLPRAALAHSLNPMPVAPALARDLEKIISQAVALLAQARTQLTARHPDDSPDFARERALADEFLSGQLLELLTVAEETSTRMLAPQARQLVGYRAVAQKLRRTVSESLADELQKRERNGDRLPEADDPEALAAFLDRAALLKKHFQEVLFLEPESKMVDQDYRHLVGLSGAAAASVGYFALQTLQSGAFGTAGLGISTMVMLGALAYALKDRMKELTKQWLQGKLSHLYANRLLTLRAPVRLDAARPIVLQARESIAQSRVARPDPLNPGAGAVQRVVTLRYKQVARVKSQSKKSLLGFERVKLVFRYDLAPLLSRLDDSVKRVPVPGVGRQRVRFADAPRLYRVALHLAVRTAAGEEVRDATVVLQRQGIARIVPQESAVVARELLTPGQLSADEELQLLPQ